ncbi:MAG: hypothetical protein C0391_07120 [Anaerolinea sp.]|nr:hypothetical protein [Anaerolinea sp.]
MVVSFDAFGLGNLGTVIPDSNGYYEKELPAAVQYIVSIEPRPATQIGIYSLPAGFLPERRLIVRNAPESMADFTVRDGGILWLKAYTESGWPMTTQDYRAPWITEAYPVGSFPHGESIQMSYSGFPLYWGWIQNSEKNIPCVILPPGEPAEIWMLWRLPEVGTTFLHADNGGKGFSVTAGEILPINLLFEFARTEYGEALQQYQELQQAGYLFSSDLQNRMDQAHQNWAIAENSAQQGSESDSAVYSTQVLTNVIQAREQMALEKSQQDIDHNRKGNINVILVSDSGVPFANTRVDYRQVSHDFVFSVGWPFPQQYQALREAGFEYACFESWWGEIETSDGVYQFPDATVKDLQVAGFGTVMYASVWTTSAYQLATPGFLSGASPSQLSAQAGQYSHDVIQHYKDQVKIYNAFNEPDQFQAYSYTTEELINLVQASNDGAHSADPNVLTNIAISVPAFKGIMQGGTIYSVAYDMYGNVKPGVSYYDPPIFSGYDFLQAAKSAGVTTDMVGLEFYYGVVLPSIDLGLFNQMLEHYSNVSDNIFLSELSYATLDDYPNLEKQWEWYGGWHQGYTDQAQADWARSTMTIAFSKPYVHGIQWVGASDGPTDYDFVGDGLFHSDMVTPRPIVSAISDLIHDWTTNGTGTTDSNGSLPFRGYGGEYELTITTQDGQLYRAQAHIAEQEDNSVKLVVDTTPPVIKSATSNPNIVRNGDYLEIKVNTDEIGVVVTVDVSSLDTTKDNPVTLDQSASGTYASKFAIGVLNTAPNGVKTLPVYMADSGGNVSETAIELELNNPTPLLDPVPPDDNFDGSVLDTSKWNLNNDTSSSVDQNGKLIMKVNSTPASSGAMVTSTWVFTGDFDVQVDFQIGEGWNTPAREHLDGATMGVAINGQTYHITRLKSSNQDLFFAWSNQGTLTKNWPTTVLSGKYRLVRVGENLFLLYDSGAGWQELESVIVPVGPAQVYLGNTSVNASQAFTTYFDNFKINSGLTTYNP